jgi:hypothetical protein
MFLFISEQALKMTGRVQNTNKGKEHNNKKKQKRNCTGIALAMAVGTSIFQLSSLMRAGEKLKNSNDLSMQNKEKWADSYLDSVASCSWAMS